MRFSQHEGVVARCHKSFWQKYFPACFHTKYQQVQDVQYGRDEPESDEYVRFLLQEKREKDC